MRQYFRLLLGCVVPVLGAQLIALVALQSVVQAQTNGTWNNTAGGDYNSSGNWVGNTIANGAGATADFNTLDVNGDPEVTLDSALTIGNLIFGDTNLGSGGSWAITTANLGTAILTLDGNGPKPTITVNELTPTSFDDTFIGNSVAGTSGFTKLGAGILTLGPGTTNTITGGIEVNGGTLRVLGVIPEQPISIADGATLETAVTVREMTVAPGASATVRADTSGGTVTLGGILGAGTGESLDFRLSAADRVDADRDWSGFDNVSLTGETDASSIRLRINQGGGNAFFDNSFENTHLHLDNMRLWVRTNSYGNTLPIGELTGTATGSLSGGNAGSAARWEVGGNNTSSTFLGSLDGNGGVSLNKVGTGTLTLAGGFVLNGDNSLAIANSPGRQGGTIRVSEGTLAMTGASSVPGGFGTTLTTIDVAAGATFDVSGSPGTFSTSALQKIQGSGTVVGTYNHADGFIHPADVPAPTADGREDQALAADVTPTGGTINFNGDLQLNGGTILYDMTLDPNSGNDLVHVTGTTALNGGSIVPNFFAGIPAGGLTYTVLTSDGGFSGNVSNISVNFPGRGADPTAFLTGNSLQFTTTLGGASAALVWTGATNSDWDIESTQNWDNGGSPDVFFDLDTTAFDESAGNKSVTVNTIVAPSSITIDNTSAYSFTGTGAIIGPTGLTKTGAGMLTMQVANTFTGPASVTGTVDIGGFGSALGVGDLTMTDTTLLTTADLANATMDIPTGTTSTIQADGTVGAGGAMDIPDLTGGGTLTLTTTVEGKWFGTRDTSQFTGTLNILPSAPATLLGTVRIRTASTFPDAVVNVTGATIANQSGAAAGSTATFEFGELHGDAASILNGFVGGGTSPNANWVIGGLNTDSDFAGTIIDGAGGGEISVSSVTKVGTGTLTLTGANTYTGDTTVDAGTLSINSSFLPDLADVLIADGAFFNLNFGGTDTINALYLGGIPQSPGVYGAGQTSLITGGGTLTVTMLGPELGVLGDYNNNGVVDAADYTVWRDNLDSAFVLPNRDPANMGNVSQDDYDSWKGNFGAVAGAGAGSLASQAAVPEPSSLVLVFLSFIGLLGAGSCRRR